MPGAPLIPLTGDLVWDGWTTDDPTEQPTGNISNLEDEEEVNATVNVSSFSFSSLGFAPEKLTSIFHDQLVPAPPTDIDDAGAPFPAFFTTPFREATAPIASVSSPTGVINGCYQHSTNPSYPERNPLPTYPPELEISGSTIAEAVEGLVYIIQRCHGDNDATMLLTGNRRAHV